jgi:tRNA (guanine37-N1)-methyltransferase
MHFQILTLFPEAFSSFLQTSIMGRAVEQKKITVDLFDIRNFTTNKHRKVDDEPYGGGAGMLMTCQPLFDCIDHVQNMCKEKAEVIYFSAQGKRFDQKLAEKYATTSSRASDSAPSSSEKKRIILICGHYEGIDQRVIDNLVDTEVCIGPYVLTGGELPAQIFIDAIARLLPDVLGKEASHQEESFSECLDGGLEYPHYTRPSDFKGHKVPEILLSGHHAKIEEWIKEQSKIKTIQFKANTDLETKKITPTTQ